MMISWWFLWMAFMFVFFVSPISYGWGYRRWGPPYPRYVQRRRAQRLAGLDSAFNHHSWGLGGDFVWMALLVGVFWVVIAVWGR